TKSFVLTSIFLRNSVFFPRVPSMRQGGSTPVPLGSWQSNWLLRETGTRVADESCFQDLNGVPTLIQSRNGVDIKIHTESVAELIGHQLRIDAGLTRETGMRAAHDLKRGPVELDRLQPRCNEPTPGVVSVEWRGPLCRRKDPCVGIRRPTLLPPFPDPVACR